MFKVAMHIVYASLIDPTGGFLPVIVCIKVVNRFPHGVLISIFRLLIIYHLHRSGAFFKTIFWSTLKCLYTCVN